MPSSNDTLSQESSDAHFVATVRCVLYSAVSLTFALDSPTRARFSELSYLIYGFYVLYVSYRVLLYMAARWWRPTLPGIVEPWLDVGWAVGLVVLSNDRSEILFGLAFFALLIATFQVKTCTSTISWLPRCFRW
jgi:hypothetical protein